MSEFPPASVYELSGQHAPKEPSTGPIELSVHELGDKTERPAVVFCHGFPELAYSWRHQLPAVAAAGFRAVAPRSARLRQLELPNWGGRRFP